MSPLPALLRFARLLRDVPAADASAARPAIARAHILHRGTGVSIVLCVDADARQRAAASTLLKQIGCSSVAVRDAWEALETFSAHHPDIALILIDAGVEGLPARALLQRIGRIDARVPIVLLDDTHDRDSRHSRDVHDSHDVRESSDSRNADVPVPAEASGEKGVADALASAAPVAALHVAAASGAHEDEPRDGSTQVIGVLRKPLDAGELIAVLPAALRTIAIAVARAPQPSASHQQASLHRPHALDELQLLVQQSSATVPAGGGLVSVATASAEPTAVAPMSMIAATETATTAAMSAAAAAASRQQIADTGARSRSFQWPPSEEDLARISVIDTAAAHADPLTTWSPPRAAVDAAAAAQRESTAWSRSQRIIATAMATLCGVGLTTWLEVRGAAPVGSQAARIDAGRPAALQMNMPLAKAPRSSAPHLPPAISVKPAGASTRASAEQERSRQRTPSRGARRSAASPAASRASRQAAAATSSTGASSSGEPSTSPHVRADSKPVNASARRRTSAASAAPASTSARPPGRFAALVRDTPRIVARPFAAVWRSLRGPGATDDRLRAN